MLRLFFAIYFELFVSPEVGAFILLVEVWLEEIREKELMKQGRARVEGETEKREHWENSGRNRTRGLPHARGCKGEQKQKKEMRKGENRGSQCSAQWSL